jgi:trimeric autotransporter adhesin
VAARSSSGQPRGYKTREIREAVLRLPTALERAGDFSRSVDDAGRPIVIYDPLSIRDDPLNPGQSVRDPFPGNIIPANRIDPVARELLRRYPLPDSGRTATRSVPVSDLANQATIKLDHQVSRALRSSGMVAWYGSTEPSPLFYGGLPSDPNLGDIEREVRVLALNNLFAPGGATVYELRYGYLSFVDDFLPPAFDVSQLGFASRYTSALAVDVFPSINMAGYNGMGSGLPRETRFPSHTLNGTMTRLVGSHTIKAGADYRRVGLNQHEPGSSGSFAFSSAFTQGPNPNVGNVGSATAGDAAASLLLGLPAAGGVLIGTPFRFSVHYGALFVQDDVRVSSTVTLNLGVRYEYESGLREAANQLTVGFDRDRAFPIQVPGLTLRGGLVYAGVDGNPTHQSNPDRAKLGPRAGLSWALGDRTVVRGGYGLFWAPHQFQFPSELTLGTRGFSAATSYFSSADNLRPCPGCALRDPFPNGIDRPQGSAQGMLTGAGGDIHFNDQSRRSPYLHKFSVDVQHELPLAVTLRAGYIGSRGERLDMSGSSTAAININQLDPVYQSLGTALQQSVPNPFFGNPAFGGLSTQPNTTRGQLLRPYPQFGNVLAHQVSAGRSRYHSFTLDGQRRLRGGWGAGVNYTWSRTNDNVIGEFNFFSDRGPGAQVTLNNHDLDAEYGRSLADTPHRLNLTSTVELPFGEGRRWVTGPGLLRAVAGGWSATVVGFHQSGFPIRVVQATNNSNLLGSGQRPNVVPGANPYAENAGAYDGSCNCVLWLNPAAWSAAAPFTFGDAPRVDPRLRSPARNNWNLAAQKAERLGATTLTLRTEVINLFNAPDLTGPVIMFGQPTFGRILNSGGVARTIQLMARAGLLTR